MALNTARFRLIHLPDSARLTKLKSGRFIKNALLRLNLAHQLVRLNREATHLQRQQHEARVASDNERREKEEQNEKLRNKMNTSRPFRSFFINLNLLRL